VQQPVLGAVLLAVAAGTVLHREHTIRYTTWRPIDLPLPLSPKTIGPIDCTIDRDGIYQVCLEISRSGNASDRFRAECLLGIDFGNPKFGMAASTIPSCTESPVIDLTWQLQSLDGHPPLSVGGGAHCGRDRRRYRTRWRLF
jgi:hypothetical protein